jgi:2-polyprenyl-3-methyl-5-hydroxy-6-metoxy-1,4-benzoquinol methylase
MTASLQEEIEKQQRFPWTRSVHYRNYNSFLAGFQIQEVLRHARGGSLLDLACGDGTLTQMLAPHFRRVVGVDASADQIKRARERLPYVTFHQSLLEDLNLAENFDVITMLLVLEHVIDPVAALRGAARNLSPDGRLFVHVPNANAINRKIAVRMGTLETCEELSPFDIQVAGHRRSYTLQTLQEEFARARLKVVATGGVFYKMLSTPQIDWLLTNGPWEEGGYGWGRVGAEPKDWRSEFCRACYEIGLERPEDCNVIYAVGSL